MMSCLWSEIWTPAQKAEMFPSQYCTNKPIPGQVLTCGVSPTRWHVWKCEARMIEEACRIGLGYATGQIRCERRFDVQRRYDA